MVESNCSYKISVFSLRIIESVVDLKLIMIYTQSHLKYTFTSDQNSLALLYYYNIVVLVLQSIIKKEKIVARQ